MNEKARLRMPFDRKTKKEKTMNHFRKNILALSILSTLLFLGSSSALAQHVKTPQEVKVVNTNSNPIPTTIINNAENPVLTKVQGTTTVSGNVTISNLPDAPIPIVNHDSAKQSFRLAAHCDFRGCRNLTSVVVPSGKRLIIKYLSMRGESGKSGDFPLVFLSVTPLDPFREEFDLDVKQSLGRSEEFHSSEEVLIYVEAGESIKFNIRMTNYLAPWSVKAYASGYYVDVP